MRSQPPVLSALALAHALRGLTPDEFGHLLGLGTVGFEELRVRRYQVEAHLRRFGLPHGEQDVDGLAEVLPALLAAAEKLSRVSGDDLPEGLRMDGVRPMAASPAAPAGAGPASGRVGTVPTGRILAAGLAGELVQAIRAVRVPRRRRIAPVRDPPRRPIDRTAT